MPRTSGSFAVYCSSYNSDGLNPSFRQICVVSATPLFTPIGVSETADTRVAAAVSSVAGGYSVGVVERAIVKVAVFPVWPVSLITNGPVILLPSAFFARGTWIVWLVADGATSPCQPLTSDRWPSALA